MSNQSKWQVGECEDCGMTHMFVPDSNDTCVHCNGTIIPREEQDGT